MTSDPPGGGGGEAERGSEGNERGGPQGLYRVESFCLIFGFESSRVMYKFQ